MDQTKNKHRFGQTAARVARANVSAVAVLALAFHRHGSVAELDLTLAFSVASWFELGGSDEARNVAWATAAAVPNRATALADIQAKAAPFRPNRGMSSQAAARAVAAAAAQMGT